MDKFEALPNIGKEVARQLIASGIQTPQQLFELGAKAAWLRIKSIDDSACLHRLYALEGAIRHVKKSELPGDVKADLKAFYQANSKV